MASVESDLRRFLSGITETELLHTDLDDPLAVARLPWDGLPFHEVRADLVRAQRFLRMGCDLGTTIRLLDLDKAEQKAKGKPAVFHSASEIAGIPLPEFVATFGDDLGGPEEAERIHQLASVRAAQAELLRLGEIQSTDPWYRATRFADGPLNEVEQLRHATLSTARSSYSVLSPRAYFQALLKLKNDTVTDGKWKLIDRRRDVLELRPADDPHLEEVIPYQEVVNTVLERQLSGKVYEELASAKYPFNLPFSLPLAQAQQYLIHLGTDLTTLYQVFAEKTDPVAAAQAQLQLSGPELLYLTAAKTDAKHLAPFWGLGDVDLVATLAPVASFLSATGLTREELHELLFQDLHAAEIQARIPHRFFFNDDDGKPQGAYIDVVDEVLKVRRPPAEEGGDDVFEDLQLWHLDRLHRFIRLSRKLGWSFSDLGWVLYSSCGQELNRNAIVMIALVERLRRELGLPIDVLCSFWSEVKSIGLGSGPALASADLFDRVFNNQIARAQGTYIAQGGWVRGLYPGLEELELPKHREQWQPRLAAALGISKEDLARIEQFIEPDGGEPADPLSLEYLSTLFRLARIPASLGLSIEDFLILIESFFDKAAKAAEASPPLRGASDVTAVILELLADVTAWMKREELSAPELRYLCTGITDRRLKPLLSEQEVAQLGDTLRQRFQNVLVTPETSGSAPASPDHAQARFDSLVQTGVLDQHGLFATELAEDSHSLTAFTMYGRTWLSEAPGGEVPDPLRGLVFPRFDPKQRRYFAVDGDVDLRDKSFTIEFWARWDAKQGFGTILSQSAEEEKGKLLHIQISADTRQLKFGFYQDDLDVDASATFDGKWHRWVCRYDRFPEKNRQAVSVDGKEIGSRDAGPYQGSGKMSIGRYFDKYPAYFDGFIAELEIWEHGDPGHRLGHWSLGQHPMAPRQEQVFYRTLAEVFQVPDGVIAQVCRHVRGPGTTAATFIERFMAHVLEGDSPPADLFQGVQRLVRVVRRVGLEETVAQTVLMRPKAFDVDWKVTTIAHIRRLCELRDLAARFAAPGHPLISYFAVEHPWNAAQQLVNITGWKGTEIHELFPLLPNGELEVTLRTVLRLAECFDLAARLATPPSVLRGKVWSKLWPGHGYLPQQEAAQALLGALHGKAGAHDREKVAETVRRKLQVRQRDVLIQAVLHRLRTTLPDAPPLESPRDLYEYLLIDVEMGAEAITTRLSEATACLQLYIHRCRMHLEPGVVVKKETLELAWPLLRSYRLWEASLRLLLFPENYLKPELRHGKSQQFRELEDELQQADITDAKVEEAFRRYLDGFAEVAHLRIVASCVYPDPQAESPSSADQILALVGSCHTKPPKYYLRTARIASKGPLVMWSPWEEIGLKILADRAFALFAFGKLLLFWVVIGKEVLDEGKTVRDRADIFCSFRDFNGGWAHPQQVNNDPAEKYELGPQSSHDFLFLEQTQGLVLVYHNRIASEISEHATFERVFEITHDFTIRRLGKVDIVLKKIEASVPIVDNKAVVILSKNELHRTLDGVGWMLFKEKSGTFLLKPNPPAISSLATDFDVLRLGSKSVATLSARLLANGVNALLSTDSQRTRELPSFVATGQPGPTEIGYQERFLRLVPRSSSLGFDEANGLYYWEIFFHTPFLLADRLNTAQRFAEAQSWYERIYDPTNQCEPWQFLPLSRGAGTLVQTEWFDDEMPLYPPGTKGAVLRLNGNDGHVASTKDLRLTHSSFTIELWARWEKLDSVRRRILSHGNLHVWATSEEGGKVGFDFWNDALVVPSSDLKSWHHWAFVVGNDGKSYWREIYRDGQRLKSESCAPYRAPDGSLYLGCRPADLIPHFGGCLADVRVWRTARSGEMIAKAHRRRLSGLEEGLELYWPLQRVDGDRIPNVAAGYSVSQMPAAPLDPDALARLRPAAYRKAIGMRYIDNLVDHGDLLFRRYTRESITEATMFYVMASDLLGRRPASPAPAKQALLTATALERWFEDRLTTRPASAVAPWLPMTYFLDLLKDFQAPVNGHFLSYWDRVEDRLYKIHHGLNIDGIRQPLPLYEPALDPKALLHGGAASAGAGAGLDLDAPVPHYRFTAMLSRAQNLAARAAQLGGALLSALEKKDAEQLGLLRNAQERTVLQMNRELKELQILEAQENLSALEAGRENARARLEHYAQLIESGLSPFEIAQISTMSIGQGFSTASAIMEIAASVGYLIPQLGAPTAITFGGQQIGSSIHANSQAWKAHAEILNFASSLCALLGGFHRREQDWQLQKRLAEHDAEQIARQIQAARLRVAMTEKDLKLLDKSIEHNRAVDELLTGKFTNRELYQWMAQRLAALCFQTYQMAHDIALAAQRAFQFEQTSDARFIQGPNWDGLKKGLLAGEILQADLDRMEKAFLERNVRRLEIEKTISLLNLDPVALHELRLNGSCRFSLTELMFDLDFPGHYSRQVKRITLSFPAVIGPYQNVNATLTQSLHRTLIRADVEGVRYLLWPGEQEGPPAPIRQNWRPSQRVALSRGLNDGGLFELVLQDERYLPFEGTGAVSDWELKVNPRSIDLDRLSDVIVKLEYSALAGGTGFETAVSEEIEKLKPLNVRLLDFDRDFHHPWRQFLDSSGKGKKLTVTPEHPMPPDIAEIVAFLGPAEGGKDALKGALLNVEIGKQQVLGLDFKECVARQQSPPHQPYEDSPWTLIDIGGKLIAKHLKNLVIAVVYRG